MRELRPRYATKRGEFAVSALDPRPPQYATACRIVVSAGAAIVQCRPCGFPFAGDRPPRCPSFPDCAGAACGATTAKPRAMPHGRKTVLDSPSDWKFLGWHRFLSFTLGYTHGRAGCAAASVPVVGGQDGVRKSAYLKGKGSDLTAPTLSEDRKQTDKPVCLSGLDPVNRRGQGVSPTIVSLNSRCSLRSHVVGENDDRDSLPRD